ncbi:MULTISPECIES: bifunctional methylenetetrahydrofolate dehydrogenase/methenyltetrahydrofolate cyclohydrolase FolD [Turicibacter]|uniref:bifunctional methylenetetrahydrofolate dehydrogenase/methenyltetrahydrofolate cyclohydrolase FolD n=2 Tax=Turicibacteraceae TaxID=2810281 RepID=UPI0001FD7FBE|nr:MULTISPECIES: bifunctional methylenetetrahydrofolate dehydrogenase/methenyltetrahydrofolate cyclohydrolase FolD [Turicibacter]NAJ10248.1 bifunctional methylenetetrahydrofolate dehydrogenase/methenyltetrahydrofolate cyclohydrolase FolD [Escherichia coli]EGC93124.1 tetrahydrofolate dehydrogenase/cyclohydrolase, NAD(P)-binding domain protein [Turicibacter sp. HGF1]MCU7197401.1 bifunctional methylenetetrahydrofolate dehydrogenase/methenyltetrahydrofolate cyclohydrolase FolD [Turicibacter sanguini
MATIIDGKKVSEDLREDLKVQTEKFVEETGIQPHLVVVIVGNNPASMTYVRNKKRSCEAVGFKSTVIELADTITEADLLAQIDVLNQDDSVHGILVQLPLPKHINEDHIISAIDVKKDVDGFHPYQVGCLASGLDSLKPCTPAGVIELLKAYDIEIEGRHAVIIGRSHIVGKPLVQLLLEENATVTVCHSRTQNLSMLTQMADILIVAIGRPHFVTADMVKEGAVVVDVGINRLETGKLVGDVDFDTVEPKASYITPVPGGVGPMTITMLLFNTLKAAKGFTK